MGGREVPLFSLEAVRVLPERPSPQRDGLRGSDGLATGRLLLGDIPRQRVAAEAGGKFTLPGLLRNGWRDVHEVFESSEGRTDPRNPAKLQVTYLFGRVDQKERSARPPLTAQELLRRRPTAQDLANRIRMTVSPTGTLLI